MLQGITGRQRSLSEGDLSMKVEQPNLAELIQKTEQRADEIAQRHIRNNLPYFAKSTDHAFKMGCCIGIMCASLVLTALFRIYLGAAVSQSFHQEL